MHLQHQTATAQILQFPRGGRGGSRRPLDSASKQGVFQNQDGFQDHDACAPAIDASEAWYHAEAIEIAQQAKTT